MRKAILFVLLTASSTVFSQSTPWSAELTGEILTIREQAEIDQAYSEIDELIEEMELEQLDKELEEELNENM